MKEIIIELEKTGVLKKLIREGFVSSKLLLYYEIFLEYDKTIKTTKLKKMDVVVHLTEQFKVSESTVFRVLKIFSQNEVRCIDSDAR